MAEALLFLTSLAIILLVGIVASILSNKLKLPPIFLLIIAGIALRFIVLDGRPLMVFGPTFLTAISILALVMIIFDATSRFKLRDFDLFSASALKLSVVFLLFNLFFLTIAVKILFNIPSLAVALIFGALMAGTSPTSVLSLFKTTSNKIIDMLEIEAIFNTPLAVLLPFIILDFMSTFGGITVNTFVDQITPFLQQIIVGIGAGVVVGLIIFKLMRSYYSERVSPVALITAALFTYILAENLQGSGVLAVTALGILFGNIYIKKKEKLAEFSTAFANSLEIIVFVLVGFTINIPFTKDFLIRSSILFGILILIRALTVFWTLKENRTKEKIFMVLNMPKGMEVAVIVFTLTTTTILLPGTVSAIPILAIQGVQSVLHLSIAFILYSVLLSTIVTRFSKYFIRITVKN